MQVKISTTLPCSSERAWREIQHINLLLHIAHPLVTFEPVEPNVFPATWSDASYLVQMRVFGFIPFGEQWVAIKLNHEKFELLDDGHSNLIKQWRHKITVQRTSEGCTRYTDTIDIKAGIFTFGVWLFANVFFRHRQRRWRRLICNDFKYR